MEWYKSYIVLANNFNVDRGSCVGSWGNINCAEEWWEPVGSVWEPENPEINSEDQTFFDLEDQNQEEREVQVASERG